MNLPQILAIGVFIKSLDIMVLKQVEKQSGYVWKLYRPRRCKKRKAHKLKRRLSQRPNFMWHIGGYNKLKPFGFPIHRAIDVFSWKILWLNICPYNNELYIINYFYVNCISNIKRVPRTIRGDRGSENVTLAGMQRYFRGKH